MELHSLEHRFPREVGEAQVLHGHRLPNGFLDRGGGDGLNLFLGQVQHLVDPQGIGFGLAQGAHALIQQAESLPDTAGQGDKGDKGAYGDLPHSDEPPAKEEHHGYEHHVREIGGQGKEGAFPGRLVQPLALGLHLPGKALVHGFFGAESLDGGVVLEHLAHNAVGPAPAAGGLGLQLLDGLADFVHGPNQQRGDHQVHRRKLPGHTNAERQGHNAPAEHADQPGERLGKGPGKRRQVVGDPGEHVASLHPMLKGGELAACHRPKDLALHIQEHPLHGAGRLHVEDPQPHRVRQDHQQRHPNGPAHGLEIPRHPLVHRLAQIVRRQGFEQSRHQHQRG